MDQGFRVATFRDEAAKEKVVDFQGDGTMEYNNFVTSNEGMHAGTANQDGDDIAMTGQYLLTSGEPTNAKEENERQLQSFETQPPEFISNSQNQDGVVSFAEASQLLSRSGKDRREGSFTVLSPLADNTFRKHHANPNDEASMVTALELPSKAQFIMRDKNKQLKMTPATTILDAARSEQLQTVLMVKQPNVQTLVRRFDNHLESGEVEEMDTCT